MKIHIVQYGGDNAEPPVVLGAYTSQVRARTALKEFWPLSVCKSVGPDGLSCMSHVGAQAARVSITAHGVNHKVAMPERKSQQQDDRHRQETYRQESHKLLMAPYHALKSYQYGNGDAFLAQQVSGHIESLLGGVS